MIELRHEQKLGDTLCLKIFINKIFHRISLTLKISGAANPLKFETSIRRLCKSAYTHLQKI